MLKYLSFIVCILFFTPAGAQPFSYVYIQGDKETPFYVKFEDEMLPRFGKNYYIISELVAAPINIEILFQQNIYPPQKFTINVPENGFRGFLLTYRNGTYCLYDIHRKFYIPAGNKAEDDNYTAYTAGVATVPTDNITPASKPKDTIEPKPVVSRPPKQASAKKPAKPVVKVKSPVVKPVKAKPALATGTQPVFIDNVELKSERTGNTVPAGGVTKNKLAIINSDCPSAISNDEFDEIYKKAITRSTTGKLKYLLEKLDRCYTSNQVRQLANILPADDEKFTYLKRAYPKVTDQSAFARLENLLSTEEWKGYFRSMIQP